jgi:hypothetical protein
MCINTLHKGAKDDDDDDDDDNNNNNNNNNNVILADVPNYKSVKQASRHGVSLGPVSPASLSEIL